MTGMPPAKRPLASPGDVLVTVQPNPLAPWDSVSEWRPWAHGLQPRAYSPEGMPIPAHLDLVVSVNGRVLTAFDEACYAVQPGDALLFKVLPRDDGGGGSSGMGAIVSLGMMLMAPGMGEFFAVSLYDTLGVWGTGVMMAGKIMAAAVSLAVSGIVNAVLAPSTESSASAATSLDDSATYSWDTETSNPIQPGGKVPVPYGHCHNVKPPRIARHVTTDGDKQYLNLLYLLGETADGFENLKINGNPLSNYTGVETEFRPGAPDQTVIPWFNDAIYEHGLSLKFQKVLGEGETELPWITVDSLGEAIQALGVGITCPALCRVSGTSMTNATVKVEAQYKVKGEATWTPWAIWEITAAQKSAVMRYFRQNDLAAAGYSMRYRLAEVPPSGVDYVNDVYLEYVQEITPDDYRYPNSALLGIRALATDNLSGGEPTVTVDIKRMTVPVSIGGADVAKSAANPAWMAYDMVRNRRYGYGAAVSRILLAEFESAAEWCELKGILGSMYFDTPMDMRQALDHLGLFGRFRVLERGTKIGCISDRPVARPKQGFLATMGNTIAGSSGLGYIKAEGRADAVQVTYYDKDKGNTPIFEAGPWYNTLTRPPKVVNKTLAACNDEDLARAFAKYLLRCNQYLSRTWSTELSWQALGCQEGSVIQVANDVTAWGESGRVRAGATLLAIPLNRKVLQEPGKSYTLMVMHQDQVHTETGFALVEEAAVAAVAETVETDEITLAVPLQYAPAQDSVFSFGETTKVMRMFRVQRIARAARMRFRIESLEYAEEIYEEVGGVPASLVSTGLAAVRGLRAAVSQRYIDGLLQQRAQLYWRGAAISWTVFQRKLGVAAWTEIGNRRYPSFDVPSLEVGFVYEFAVSATSNPSDGQTVSVDFTLGDLSGLYVQVVEMVDDVLTPLVERNSDGEIINLYEVA